MIDTPALVARVLRLPPPPRPPAGSEGSTRLFRPALGYYRLRLLRWLLVQISSVVGLSFAFGWTFLPFMTDLLRHVHFGPITLGGLMASWLFRSLEILALGGFLAQLPFSFLMVRLDYTSRWYLLTDRSLRIREGLRTVREQTMSFANVQNVTIQRGPVQRLFGIADLQVRSAGGGSSKGEDSESDAKLHTAYFRGVDNAAEIRDLVLAHLRRLRSAGTGDPDDAAEPTPDDPERLNRALAEVSHEAAALRRLVGELRTSPPRM